LTTCFYNFLHKYLDDPSYTKKPSRDGFKSSSPLEILQKIGKDTRFDGLFDEQGSDNIVPLFEKREAAVLEYWNAWDISNPKKQFEDSQKAAVALLVGTHSSERKYDFFMVHLLTTSHAIRVLLPIVPAKWQMPLVRQWWLFVVAVYISQLRPTIELHKINQFELEGRDWKYVENKTLNSARGLDAHFVKCRLPVKGPTHVQR